MAYYSLGKVLVVFFVIVLVAITILAILIPVFTQDTVVATVTDKEIYTTTDCSGDNGCTSNTHLTVYTDKEVLEISDSIIFWSFGEQQKYGKLKEGKTYEFKVWGFNIPILQMYRGAYEYTEVTGDFDDQ